MLITVTTTSQTLEDILTADQETALKQARIKDRTNRNWPPAYEISIQNRGTDNIHYTRTDAAATTSSHIIYPTSDHTIRIKDLSELKLISDTNPNSNVSVE